MFLGIYALRLAVARAQSARIAFGRVDNGSEKREFREKPEHRSHGTNSVAIGATAAPREKTDDHKRRNRHRKHADSLEPHVDGIKGVAVGVRSKKSQNIVARNPYRRKKIRGDSAVRAIGGNQRGSRNETRRDRRRKEGEKADSQIRLRFCIFHSVALAPIRQFEKDILQHSERADDGTVNPAEQQRQQYQRRNYRKVGGKERGQKLDFRSPSQPRPNRTREVEEQQRHRDKKQHSQNNSNLL